MTAPPIRNLLGKGNVRGALLLGALVAAIIAIAVFISLRIYNQLDGAARVERALVLAQQQLDQVVLIQVDQAAALRGFIASGKAFFFENDAVQSNRFGNALSAFEDTTHDLQVPALPKAIAEMRQLHNDWANTIARPLRDHPHTKYTLIRQTFGKVILDQLRSTTSRVHSLLEQRLERAQNDLKTRINEALFGGLASIIVFGLVALVFVASRAQILDVLDRESSIVETLQTAFRSDLDVLPRSRIGRAYLSADSDAAVGGDLFDVRRLDADRGLVVIADISGKGIEAAVNTAFVKYSMRTLALTGNSPCEILKRFNKIFLDTIENPNLFVVAFVAIFDAATDRVTYASAGHAGAWLRRGEDIVRLDVTGPIVGLDRDFSYDERVLQLRRGDAIVLATDGLTEARDAEGTMLDEAGAIAMLRSSSHEPQACADDLVDAVRRRGGGAVHDDLALLVIGIDDGVRAKSSEAA